MPPWIYTVLGRRWFRGDEKETAALKIKAAVSNGRVKIVCSTTAFFSFAVVRQIIRYIAFI